MRRADGLAGQARGTAAERAATYRVAMHTPPPQPPRRHLLALTAALVLAPLAMTFTNASAQPSMPGAIRPRAIEFNGRPLDAAGLALLQQIEARLGPVPDGRYWYDPASGGAGLWGGPAIAYLGPGLHLGGPLPAQASGGGHGRLTGVFVNGRELHPLDVQGLATLGPVIPGRYWWDGAGNVGVENGPVLFNFHAVVAQRQAAARSGGFYHRADASRGQSTYVGKGCAAVHGRLRASDEGSSYSYYAGC
jgi:hypothetical protein